MRSTSTVCEDALTNWTACEELAIIGAVSAKWGQATSLPPQADLGEAHMYKLIFELVDTALAPHEDVLGAVLGGREIEPSLPPHYGQPEAMASEVHV